MEHSYTFTEKDLELHYSRNTCYYKLYYRYDEHRALEYQIRLFRDITDSIIIELEMIFHARIYTFAARVWKSEGSRIQNNKAIVDNLAEEFYETFSNYEDPSPHSDFPVSIKIEFEDPFAVFEKLLNETNRLVTYQMELVNISPKLKIKHDKSLDEFGLFEHIVKFKDFLLF